MKVQRIAWITAAAGAALGAALMVSSRRSRPAESATRAVRERPAERMQADVRAHPLDPEARGTLIRHLVTNGRLNDALDAAREAQKTFPGNTSVGRAAAVALAATSREPEAARLLERLPAGESEARMDLARVLLTMGEREAALRELRDLPTLPHPLAEEAARLALDALDAQTALRTLGQTASPRPGSIQGLLGRALVWTGDYDSAILYLEDALRQSPRDGEAALHLAAAVRLRGSAAQVLRARGILERLSEQTVGEPAVLYELAKCMIALNEPAPALRALESAANSAPNWSEIWEDLGRLRERRGDRLRSLMARARVMQLTGDARGAVTLLAREAARDPRNVELGLAAAAAYSHAGDQQTLRSTLRALHKRHPQNPEVLDVLAQVEADLQNHGSALEALDALEALNTVPRAASMARRRARLLQLLQRRVDAGILLRRLRDENPGDAVAHFELGALAAAAGAGASELSEAEASLREAVRLNPQYAEAHRDLGSVLQRTARSAAAIPHLRKALDLAPRDVEALRLLGLAYASSGEAERSREVFEVFRRLRTESERRRLLLSSVARVDGRGEAEGSRYRLLLRVGEWEAALRELETRARIGGMDRERRGDLAALYGRARRFQRQAEQVRLLRAGGGRL